MVYRDLTKRKYFPQYFQVFRKTEGNVDRDLPRVRDISVPSRVSFCQKGQMFVI